MNRSKYAWGRANIFLCVIAGLMAGCGFRNPPSLVAQNSPKSALPLTPLQTHLVDGLREQTLHRIRYQDGYFMKGKPPADIGVCTDVVSRAFETAGIDLKGLVDKDIAAHSEAYQIANPDPNIDYRRCRNLIVFFRRNARAMTKEPRPSEFLPGDIVFWSTHGDGKSDHVGMVGDVIDQNGVPAIVQHWPGQYVEKTTGLFGWKVTGHFRWRTT